MPKFFEPTADAVKTLERLVDEIPEIQRVFVANAKHLTRPDRTAHQQQIAASTVLLTVAQQIPNELAGLGVFQPAPKAGVARQYVGVGRISTGMGCPHAQTDPDFLGIMLAFRTGKGQRVDFIGINHPASPTDTVEQFMALLRATADAAGTHVPLGNLGLGNLAASQTKLIETLAARLGVTRALKIFAHVGLQTARTVASSSAYQQYWTGIVRANDTLGKFTLIPTQDINSLRDLSPGEQYLSRDWAQRQSDCDLDFCLYWIPFLNEDATPLDRLSQPWQEAHRIQAGKVVFPRTNLETREAKLVALMVSEMGANPGNWVSHSPEGAQPEFPGTEFTAGRFLAYRRSQQGRNALPEQMYDSFFAEGRINGDLEAELIRRYSEKCKAGHSVPDVGPIDFFLAGAVSP
jgi:hypothetical protein